MKMWTIEEITALLDSTTHKGNWQPMHTDYVIGADSKYLHWADYVAKVDKANPHFEANKKLIAHGPAIIRQLISTIETGAELMKGLADELSAVRQRNEEAKRRSEETMLKMYKAYGITPPAPPLDTEYLAI